MSPVFGSTVTGAGLLATRTRKVPAGSWPLAVRATALPLSPAATCQRSRWVPATTGVTCHSKVFVRPAASAPRAQVLT